MFLRSPVVGTRNFALFTVITARPSGKRGQSSATAAVVTKPKMATIGATIFDIAEGANTLCEKDNASTALIPLGRDQEERFPEHLPLFAPSLAKWSAENNGLKMRIRNSVLS